MFLEDVYVLMWTFVVSDKYHSALFFVCVWVTKVCSGYISQATH